MRKAPHGPTSIKRPDCLFLLRRCTAYNITMNARRTQNMEKRIHYAESFFPRSDDGSIEIPVNGSSLFNEFNDLLPSDDVMSYLFSAAENILPGERLLITYPDTSSGPDFRQAVRNLILMEMRITRRRLALNTLFSICFLAFGAFVLALSFFLDSRTSLTFSTTVNVIGTFAIWEAADIFIFRRTEFRRTLAIYLRLLGADWTARR